ncbi:YesL family protein [Oceanobacillus sp. J11TS1]|uniref:YesL family protein n=1 Tax=Oceanobacillus sp. J11TS1 TaxID=2807191 RepID=UPI001B0C4722|nr:DUF624 domain-containing protein [Oceanobacillus sp. J11TS1]GIO23845.1 hypothetical protein J11TS1_24260 [Oceanobacillus sp. J11TS1]
MKITGAIGGVYSACEWVMRFALLNVVWLAVNSPVLLVVWSMWRAASVQEIILLSIPLLGLFPTLFYPATAGLFAVVRDWIMTAEKESMVKEFFSYAKENYQKSLLAGSILGVIWTITIVNYVIVSQSSTILAVVFLFFAFLLLVVTVLFLSILVHYQLSSIELLKKTLLYTFGCPFLAITILISVIIIFLMGLRFPFLMVFFSWSLLAFITFSAFYRTFLRLREKQA